MGANECAHDICPLRDGAKHGVVVGAESQSQASTVLSALSEDLLVSIMIPVPPSQVDMDPPWLRGEVTKQMKAAKIVLGAEVAVAPYEVERQIRMDGDGESWWVSKMVPKRQSSARPRTSTATFIQSTLSS